MTKPDISYEDADNNPDDPLQDVRFKQSLPMHCTPLTTGKFAYNVLSQMDPELDRCKYGLGKSLSHKQQRRNLQHLHNLDEAMRIDAFLSGSDALMLNRRVRTSGLLFSIFDVAMHVHFLPKTGTKYGGNLESFDNYALEVEKAQEIGASWIETNCEPHLATQHRVLVGWAAVLSHQFLLNYAYLCKKMYQRFEERSKKPTFSLIELLGKIGLDSRTPQLLLNCSEYSMSDSQIDFNCILCDKEVTVPISTCLQERPITESVVDSIDDRGTISKLGKGWDKSTCETWFKPKTVGKDDSPGVVKVPNDRNISCTFEAEETLLILKTLHSVTLDYESDTRGKGYSMTCKVDDIIKKRPSVLEGEFKEFYLNPSFECSNCMITSLPFNFVQKLRLGKSVHLPKEWKAEVKKDAQSATSSSIASILLWRSRRMIGENEKMITKRIYRAVYQNTDANQRTTQIAYLSEGMATKNLRSEPWIIDHVRALCTVRSYRQLNFGEGAKTSRLLSSDDLNTNVNDNFWYSKENHAKLCTEGAVANMLFHMKLPQEAEEFREVVTKPEKEMLVAMQATHVPKRVRDRRNKSMLDPMEKCMWILERKYDCRRFLYLNPDQHKTAEKLQMTLAQIRLPIMISVLGQHSVYNHVVVAWRGIIIDFETRQPYPLTLSNVDNICGAKNPFMKLTRGYVICPSRRMKIAVGDLSDWGEQDIRKNLMHLFRKHV